MYFNTNLNLFYIRKQLTMWGMFGSDTSLGSITLGQLMNSI